MRECVRGLPREKDGIVVQAFKTARFYGDILSAVHVQGRAVVQAPVPATGDPEPLQKRRSGISPADTLVVSFCACACMWLCLCVDVRMRDRGIGISVMISVRVSIEQSSRVDGEICIVILKRLPVKVIPLTGAV